MLTNVDRNQVRQLVQDGATLVEVLPAREYEDEHIAGAIDIPLAELSEQAPKHLSRDQGVIVYCNDRQRDLSARAAWRLESLGSAQIYRYLGGKQDWLAFDLPTAGKRANTPRAGSLDRRGNTSRPGSTTSSSIRSATIRRVFSTSSAGSCGRGSNGN